MHKEANTEAKRVRAIMKFNLQCRKRERQNLRQDEELAARWKKLALRQDEEELFNELYERFDAEHEESMAAASASEASVDGAPLFGDGDEP